MGLRAPGGWGAASRLHNPRFLKSSSLIARGGFWFGRRFSRWNGEICAALKVSLRCCESARRRDLLNVMERNLAAKQTGLVLLHLVVF